MALYAFDGTNDDSRARAPTRRRWSGIVERLDRFYSAYDGIPRHRDKNLVRARRRHPVWRGRPRRRRRLRRRLARSRSTTPTTPLRGVGGGDRPSTSLDSVAARRRARFRQQGVRSTASGTARPSSSPTVDSFRRPLRRRCRVRRREPRVLVRLAECGYHPALTAENVQHCFHAMSLDERRPSFVNQRVDERV